MTKNARKKTTKKPDEPMFLGNSAELKQYLVRKRDALKALQVKTKDEERENILGGMIYTCEMVVDLPYFKRGKVRSMPELIEAVKAERDELKSFMTDLQPDLDAAKKEAEEAFKAAGSYLANKFEDSYKEPAQINARECIDEYQALQYEYDQAEDDLKTNWWLLGIIHRPTGFFSKADE